MRLIFSLLCCLIAGTGLARAMQGAALETSLAQSADQETPATQNAAPEVLTAQDAARYREIFALQEDGRWREADALIADVENPILMGYVQHQRYMHPTDYRSSFRELKQWMAYYADHPMATEVYRLAVKRRPRNETPPIRPIPRKWRVAPGKTLHPDLESDYDKKGRARLTRIEGRVRYLAKRDEALTALREIDDHVRRGTITERQYDRMRSWIAASLYYQGYVGKAKSLANASVERNGESAVLAYWIAGLIAFREGDIARAHDLFAAQAAIPYQEDELRAAAGFWAARTALGAAALPLNVAVEINLIVEVE